MWNAKACGGKRCNRSLAWVTVLLSLSVSLSLCLSSLSTLSLSLALSFSLFLSLFSFFFPAILNDLPPFDIGLSCCNIKLQVKTLLFLIKHPFYSSRYEFSCRCLELLKLTSSTPRLACTRLEEAPCSWSLQLLQGASLSKPHLR